MGGYQDEAVATTGTATGRGSGSSTRSMPNQAVEVAFTGCIAHAIDTALEGKRIALSLRKGKNLDTDDEVFEETVYSNASRTNANDYTRDYDQYRNVQAISSKTTLPAGVEFNTQSLGNAKRKANNRLDKTALSADPNNKKLPPVVESSSSAATITPCTNRANRSSSSNSDTIVSFKSSAAFGGGGGGYSGGNSGNCHTLPSNIKNLLPLANALSVVAGHAQGIGGSVRMPSSSSADMVRRIYNKQNNNHNNNNNTKRNDVIDMFDDDDDDDDDVVDSPVTKNNNKPRITQPATTETPNTALVTATKTKLITQAKPTINIDTGLDELLTSTVKEDVKHMYKVQNEMGPDYLCDCANAARALDPNATPSDVVALVGNIDRFPSEKKGRLVIVSSNKNKNKKRKKGQPKEDTTK